MRTWLWNLALAAIAIAFADPAAAQLDYGIVIHMSEPDYAELCDAFDDATFTCADVQPEGTPSTHWAWFAVYGYDNAPGWTSPGIRGVQFGVEFDPGVTILAFMLCTGGTLMGTSGSQGYPDWPNESGCGAAITWSGGDYDSPGKENFARTGCFLLLGSGRMAVAGDPRLLEYGHPTGVMMTDPNSLRFDIPVEGFSSADVAGDLSDFDGFAACLIPPTPVNTSSWGRIKSLY